MREDLLQFIWKHQLFDRKDLITISGNPIIIFNQGFQNLQTGPDFLEAKLVIDNLVWHGTIEIHTKSSHWNAHQHSINSAYDNVILHVVWENDLELLYRDNSPIPTLELKNRIDESMISKYQSLLNNVYPIPCYNQFTHVSYLVKQSMFDKALVERVQQKAKSVIEILKENKYDWESTTYKLLLKNFGFSFNAPAFTKLSEVLPYHILKKYHSLSQIEALLFGQAGFLDQYFVDDYSLKVKEEYSYLSKKHNLYDIKMNNVEWKTGKVRPANFPTIRIAEFSSLFYNVNPLFSFFMNEDISQIISKIRLSSVSDYWKSHLMFDKLSNFKYSGIGKNSIDIILINTVVPLLAAYFIEKDSDSHMNKAMALLESLNKETNNITCIYEGLKYPMNNAWDSQAAIGLYKNYCSLKKCLCCSIGSHIISESNYADSESSPI